MKHPRVAEVDINVRDTKRKRLGGTRAKKALCLGMVFASDQAVQEYGRGSAAERDRSRLKSLEKEWNMQCYTFDRDHPPEKAEFVRGRSRHAQGDWSTARAASTVADCFSGVTFDLVLIDYFRMPMGYANTALKPRLFTVFLPTLVRKEVLKHDAIVYVQQNVAEELDQAGALQDWKVTEVPAASNPLWVATEKVASQDAQYSNQTQTRMLKLDKEFVQLQWKGH